MAKNIIGDVLTMDRNYNNGSHSSKDGDIIFVGTEVEHTPAYGMRTLFVTGIQDTARILWTAKEESCEHIYLGANMSFNVTENTYEQWQPWETMGKELLEEGLWVTLDVDVSQVEGLLETGLTEYNQFIPMISVKLPYVGLLGYNACLKIDDKDFAASNPGVWVHRVHNLKNQDVYTPWYKYKEDSII